MNFVFIQWLSLIYYSRIAFGNENYCPSKCICKRSDKENINDYIKIKCGDSSKIVELDELDLLNIATEVVQLNLSDNLLTSFVPKYQLIALQKLDLSKNHLKSLVKEQFSEIPNLRRLDISENNIDYIDPLAFLSLRKLERLKLNQNEIKLIELGTFSPLSNLKQLDISNNPITCDCKLLWLLNYSQKFSVKLVGNPKCSGPSSFKGLSLRKLKISIEKDCTSSTGAANFSLVHIEPSDNQVVFQGDSLRLHCRTYTVVDNNEEANSQIEWLWVGDDPIHHFPDVRIETHYLSSTGGLNSSLSVPNLNSNHSGLWSCLYVSAHGNFSKTISVVVISEDTRYCPIEVTNDNKGSYVWPKTVLNNTVSMTCQSLNLTLRISEQKATYFCDAGGEWRDLNTTSCSYVSETTKILQQFSRVNTSILESAELFRNYTSHLKLFRDVMDFIFTVNTIENYLIGSPSEQLGAILVDVINNLLDLPKTYIEEADHKERVCGTLVNALENLAGITLSPQSHKMNVALEKFTIDKSEFTGMKCTWFVNPDIRPDRLFYCVTSSQADTVGIQGKVIEASITIPETLFHSIRDERRVASDSDIQKILITMFANSKLFPLDRDRRSEAVTSAVVGAKLDDLTIKNLTDPIFIMLRTPATISYEVLPFTPVWWDPDSRNGTGEWSSEGCEFKHEFQEHVVFSCYQFGYYGLMQDVSYIENVQTSAKFKLSHPAIYVGSSILFVCLLISIVTYLMCFAIIQMPKKAKHSLINVWASICFLCFMYNFGIYQTEDVRVCRFVGMSLHYFTLSSFLWLCVCVNCMYKRLNRNAVIGLQDDELPPDQPIQKPILGLYLVGWGVAFIVCGISAAINIREYSSPTHCFLRTGPALSALYVPFSILILFLISISMLVRCAIYNVDANGHLSEGTQATENVDLDLLEPNFPNPDTRSTHSSSSKTASSEAEDPEHAPIIQLRAYVIFVIIYVTCWLSCAFATVQPFHFSVYEEHTFSFVYALLSTLLGAFTLFFYCIARVDVRTHWGIFFRWLKKNRSCFRTRNVSDTYPNVPQIQVQPLPAIPNAAVSDLQVVTSRSSSRSSNNTKNSNRSNILKAAATDLNGLYNDGKEGTKINNVNLIALHRQQYRSSVIPNIIENPTDAADVFYNPHQSTTARKFFKRQKRHLTKRNNIPTRPQRDQSSDARSVMSEPPKRNGTLDSRIFGTSSKVNNTNIHFEQVRKTAPKNPNLFSDSTDDSSNDVSVENVLNAQRSRKKEIPALRNKKKNNQSLPRNNNMRSIAQQCTLDYNSSETISDSILDKTSPDKNVLNRKSSVIETRESIPERPTEVASVSIEEPVYCNIQEIRREMETEYFNRNGDNRRLSPSENSLDLCSASKRTRILVNPSHDILVRRGAQSRASSVSVSDLDELYQQIRRGSKSRQGRANVYLNKSNVVYTPCLSDSEITSYSNDVRYRRRTARSNDNLGDNDETRV